MPLCTESPPVVGMTPRDRDGSFTHPPGVMHLFPTGVKKVHGGMAWFLKNPAFYSRCTKESTVDPVEVSKNGGILLANSKDLSFSSLIFAKAQERLD